MTLSAFLAKGEAQPSKFAYGVAGEGALRATARIDHADLPPETVVTRLHAEVGLSRLFEVVVDVACQDPDLDLAAFRWSTAAVSIVPESDSPPRCFHGVVEAAAYTGSSRLWHRYRFRLRPSLAGIGYRVRTRIFQDLPANEIVQQVLTEAGVPSDSFRWDTENVCSTREYCTQWKESELDFVRRLLEEEGIFFWFEHTEVDHLLCFGDLPKVFADIEGDPMLTVQRSGTGESEAVWDLIEERRVVHDATRTRDWSFMDPAKPFNIESGDDGVRLRYEYPGRYTNQNSGEVRTQVHLDEAWTRRRVLTGASSSVRFAEGRIIDLVDVYPSPLAERWVLTRVVHRFDGGDADVGDPGLGAYSNTFEAVPATTRFAPPRVTPRPSAHGLESAVVTGPSGEEIHVDEYGRIKVHFYWDRENPVDDTASCWVRFQQVNTVDAMILPRVGWEVHVAFENGDPDRPVAFHKAYNQETAPPYAQPANKTQSALQSSTSPGGGSTNEVRLQDGNGGMEWFLHASKDLNVFVAHDQEETVGIDSMETVGNDMDYSVGADESGSVGANRSLSVTAASADEIVGSRSVSIGGNDDWGIKKNFGFATGADRSDSIGGLMNVLANEIVDTFNANLTRNVGAVQAIASATAIAETVGGNKTENVSAAKAVVTPAEYAESIGGVKTLTSGAVTVKTGGDVQYGAKGAIALTSAAVIDITCSDDAMFNGSQVRVTSGSASFKGGGGEFKLGGSITIDAKKFGGKAGPMLKLQGKIDYKD